MASREAILHVSPQLNGKRRQKDFRNIGFFAEEKQIYVLWFSVEKEVLTIYDLC